MIRFALSMVVHYLFTVFFSVGLIQAFRYKDDLMFFACSAGLVFCVLSIVADMVTFATNREHRKV